jgi:hypothetical protein
MDAAKAAFGPLRQVQECPLLGGGFNWSSQHFSLSGKMECKPWPIAAEYFSQTNRSQRSGIVGSAESR